MGRFPGRVFRGRDREVAEPLRRGAARGLSPVDRLAEPGKPEGRDPLEVGGDEEVPSAEGRDLVLDVQARQEPGRLAEDPEESVEVVPFRQRGRDVDRDDDLGSHLPDHVHGQVPRHAAVDEEPALPLDRREEARDRHARAERPGEVPGAEDDDLSGLDVRRDGAVGNRETVEVAHGRGRPREPAQVVAELLARDETGGDDDLTLREPQLGVDQVERVVLLPAVVPVLPSRVVGEGVLPVDRPELLGHPVGRHADRVEAADDRPDARPGHVVDRDPHLLEHLQDPDEGAPPGASAGEGEADPRAPRRFGAFRLLRCCEAGTPGQGKDGESQAHPASSDHDCLPGRQNSGSAARGGAAGRPRDGGNTASGLFLREPGRYDPRVIARPSEETCT